MGSLLIKNARIVNEGKITSGHLYCENGLIEKIIHNEIPGYIINKRPQVIEAENKYLIPGIIDDQVHFREPGLTHKADIRSESRAAIAGGITSYLEMPNTSPPTTTRQHLEEKLSIARSTSMANYSFFMGATNDNLKELLDTDPLSTCGIKIFMGSSTGNMLVDNESVLRSIFSKINIPVAVHCEDESVIQANILAHRRKYGENIPVIMHPAIRSEEACFKSSSHAVELAREYGTRLHVLHISTEKELALFDTDKSLENKRITSEVCIHHLWFDQNDYAHYGSRIKWNPAVKTKKDKDALIRAVREGRIDVIATDHAPHTIDEKSNTYFKSPSGGPMVQHALAAMMELVNKGMISIEKVVERMCHAPAIIFNIEKRGYIREGYYADFVLLDTASSWIVKKENILYKCGWSPMEGQEFSTTITHTILNGHVVYEYGVFDEHPKSMQLSFKR